MTTFHVGRAAVTTLVDGTFLMAPDFLAGPVDPGTDERDTRGRVPLPIQAFLVRGRRTVVVDAGLGPDPEGAMESLAAHLGIDRAGIGLFGHAGLGPALAEQGVAPDDIDVVVVSHLHADHTGWLTGQDGTSIFRNARLLLPRADYELFVAGERRGLVPATREALRALVASGQAELFDGEETVSPEITALPAPGHTPGHTVFAIAHGGERAMILGDAMYCPAQLGELEIGAMHDVDPALARRTRELIARDAEAHGTLAVGCHFAGGRAARLVNGRAVVS
ncbi:MBL fold metallo-hydrolase [Pseudofrankia asymbiotica]|uniref:Metallo-beta-lactamase domain-containing protein n=1 Tax=Pseudofrankia asymbiotica TaxID=1834516 RepID=A0A1V2I9K7_9ACTN|nr:MBL fold metallo-hydrolase [Pseudofrankia asymbiotica]ONH27983.1 hypothetical protein BL253_20450 [Pseudofrankia asymbiotica]